LELPVFQVPGGAVVLHDGEIEGAELDAGLRPRVDVAADAPTAAVSVFHRGLVDAAEVDRVV